MRLAPLSGRLALALAVALAAGCDQERDTGTAGDAPDTAAPPTTLPPPVAGADLDPGTDATPGPLPIPGDDGDADDVNGEATVPSRFQGRYAANQAACDASGDPTRLAIESDAIRFHESTGPITDVASGPSDITITAELTGEGETREATYRFRLGDDGETLTDLDGNMERVRCD